MCWMLIKSRKFGALWIAGLVGLLALACAGPTPAEPPPAAPTDAGATPPAATAEASPYDANSQMYKVFPGFGLTSADTFTALDGVREQGDKSMVPVLVESMRFQSSKRARDATEDVLESLTGQAFGEEPWLEWSNWLGRNREAYPPPSDYLAWKMKLMSQIDPRFALLLRPAREGQITVDPTELVWGGVIPDGIPDLRSPKMLSPDEAGYLRTQDRVFGVSINGDNRAYPIKTLSRHEIVNDVVGGESIAVTW